MASSHLTWVLAVLLLPAALIASDGLVWETQTIETRAPYGAPQVTADFGFVNQGSAPVTIVEVNSSCGCTTTGLDKRTFAPGESGKITAVFTVGSRMGTQRNMLRVVTNEGGRRMTDLHFTVVIPEAISISPRLLHWRQTDERTAKTAVIDVAHDSPLQIRDIEVDGDSFEVNLEKDPEIEGRYHLVITPVAESGIARGMVMIRTEPETARPRQFTVFAYVR
ncbi:MAG: DUF1573 domain-containing protein [Puniceicoccaceae bacterium]|nr:MAG: DUF1573 domain-containing protein [Puniceicoccaceae bacterium]